jgi:hypothetical protein
MGLIFCGVCGGRMLSRPRDDHTKRYVCAGHRLGHQLAILAEPADELVANRVVELLTTPAFREALLAQVEPADDGAVGRALAELGTTQSRLQRLDDDYYVQGALGVRRYRSMRTKLEREVERLHANVDRASKQRVILHPDPERLWFEADLGQRRELVRVICRPGRGHAGAARGPFDPHRVRICVGAVERTPGSEKGRQTGGP